MEINKTAKEWIFNSVTNRFQLKFKRNVGAISEAIRKCSPKNLGEWREFYFANVRSKEHIEELGRKLYTKITEIVQAEIEDVTEQECIDYMINLVIDRTFDGYMTEISTVYGQLENLLGVKIEPAPDEWDRLYNVDFYIEINGKYIGMQIKPISSKESINSYNWIEINRINHEKFTKKFGGKVFYIFSIKQGDRKIIANIDVIQDIKNEITRIS
jgi:hypothetical protein